MLILKIRQAEVAAADGRLDEAFELIRNAKLRSHRRGQDLAGKLIEAYVQRGRTHLEKRQHQQALADWDKAAILGGNLPDLAELRAAATEALADGQRRQRDHAAAAAQVRRQIEDGHLARAEDLLAGLSVSNSQAAVLEREAGVRRNGLQAAVERAERALRDGDVDAAVGALLKAQGLDQSHAPLAELAASASRLLRQGAASAIAAGRLNHAEAHLRRLEQLGQMDSDATQLRQVLGQCRLAWEQIEKGLHRSAEQILRRLMSVVPDAKWLADAAGHLRQVDEAIDVLRAGPLSWLGNGEASNKGSRHLYCALNEGDGNLYSGDRDTGDARNMGAGDMNATAAMPPRFLIQVDSCGTFLVLRQPRVTVGPVSSSARPDVGLIADPAAPAVTIERIGDDYFARSRQPIVVNDRPMQSKLLAGGDRIALTPRCRVQFALPSPASTTAVLELTGGRLPRSDIRRVILLDRELIIGPGPASHIRVHGISQPLVLQLHDDRLLSRSDVPVMIDDRPMDRRCGIGMNCRVQAGGVSFVVLNHS